MARNWVGVYVNMAELLPMSNPEPAKKIREITRIPSINEQILLGISKLITNCIRDKKQSGLSARTLSKTQKHRDCLKT